MDLRFIGLTQCSVWYWCFIFLHPVSWLSHPRSHKSNVPCGIGFYAQSVGWVCVLVVLYFCVLLYSYCFVILFVCCLICVGGVPCGIGISMPSQLIIHTVLFVCFAIFLSLFEFLFVYMVFRVVLALFVPSQLTMYAFYICVVFALLSYCVRPMFRVVLVFFMLTQSVGWIHTHVVITLCFILVHCF